MVVIASTGPSSPGGKPNRLSQFSSPGVADLLPETRRDVSAKINKTFVVIGLFHWDASLLHNLCQRQNPKRLRMSSFAFLMFLMRAHFGFENLRTVSPLTPALSPLRGEGRGEG